MTRAGQLHRDQRGAIMLLGVLMAVFLTALLYYIVGIGEAIMQRERMQDAADAAAFSAAVVHARGMNVLALINMVMAALLAIIVALRLVETLTTIAIVAISLASFFQPELAGAIPELAELRASVREAEAAIKPAIDTALETLHAAAVALRTAVPLASEIPVMTSVRGDYSPPVDVALVVLPAVTLPTKDGTFADLCEKADQYLGAFAEFALGSLVPEPVADIVGGALAALAKAGAGWFCGDAGSAPPKTTVTQKATYPTLPSRQHCIDYEPSQTGYDAGVHEQLCAQAKRDEDASHPNADSGQCVTSCGRDELYEQRDALARRACAPRDKGDKLGHFEWQERTFTRTYLFEHERWRVQSDKDAEEGTAHYALRRDDARRPCGPGVTPISTDWNLPLRSAGSDELLPLCSNAALPTNPGFEGQSKHVRVLEVPHFFGCSEHVERTYDLSKYANDRVSGGDGASGERKVPQVLNSGLELGDEDFQLRAVVVGELPSDVARKVLEVATWKAPPAPSVPAIWDSVRELGRFSVAQAEYYFDLEEPSQHPKDFMWSMRWKARLRRFRLPEPKAGNGGAAKGAIAGSFGDACNAVAAKAASTSDAGAASPGESPCSSIDPSLSDLIAH